MIKEILYLEDYINKYKYDEKAIINGNRLTTPAMLDYLEAKELIDYITNLQKENENRISESLSYDLATARVKELENKITNLQEENERLKEILHWKRDREELLDKKARIDKAIEYINLTGYGTDFSMIAEEVDVLFNILKGE